MKAFVACIALALVACASAEAPSGYNYNRPSGGGGGGYSGGSGGGYSGGGGSGGGLIGGGPYRSVPAGYTTSEGQNVDPQLLEQIKNILLKEESQSGSGGGHGGGHSGGGAPSSSYGAPSASYGPPSTSYGVPSARVVGIVLDGVRQAIQVAQYEQSGGSSGGGYPASSVPSGSYGAPY